jgi:hypothetical protein
MPALKVRDFLLPDPRPLGKVSLSPAQTASQRSQRQSETAIVHAGQHGDHRSTVTQRQLIWEFSVDASTTQQNCVVVRRNARH